MKQYRQTAFSESKIALTIRLHYICLCRCFFSLKGQRPILCEVFLRLEDRGTWYEPLLIKLFPPETRSRQREVLIEIYRKGKIAEAFRAFKKIYLEIVEEVIDYLKSQGADDSSA
jgi:hypothetical protein